MRLTKRRRVASSASCSRGDVTPDRGIWLDKLPEEVCQRVAAHVCRCEQNSDALALAKTSSVLRRAVLGLLRNRLTIHDKRYLESFTWPTTCTFKNWDSAALREWIPLMGEDLFELDQSFTFFLRGQPPRLIVPVISLPNLRVAEIYDHPAQVAAVARSSSIQEVVLILDRKMPAREIFEAVSNVPLAKLRIVCLETWQRGNNLCPFRDPDITESSSVIADYFPHLTSIDVTCDCRYGGESMLWKVIPSLKTLKEISFCWPLPPATVPQEALRFLSSRDVVRILNSCDALQLASRIGVCVAEIFEHHIMDFDVFTAKKVLDLRNYPRLRVLGFKIKEGADEGLPEVVEQLPDLRTLNLLWAKAEHGLRGPCKHTGSRFAEASSNVMLRAVQAAPQLRTLCIAQVRIALTELLTILKLTGTRLRFFETSVGDQEEAPFERLEALLLGVARHNTELREFSVEDIEHDRGPIPEKEWEEQGRRVMTSLGVVGQRAPYLSVRKLNADLQSMQLWRQ